MQYIKFAICGFLMLWFADCVGCGRIDWRIGTVAALLFLKGMVNAVNKMPGNRGTQ